MKAIRLYWNTEICRVLCFIYLFSSIWIDIGKKFSCSFLPFNYNTLNINRNDSHQQKFGRIFIAANLLPWRPMGSKDTSSWEAKHARATPLSVFVFLRRSSFRASRPWRLWRLCFFLRDILTRYACFLVFLFVVSSLADDLARATLCPREAMSFPKFSALAEFRSLPFFLWPSRGKEWTIGYSPSITL